ncbi:cytochrome aa3 quinol oxidase subunit II [Virgibacillus sp. NKC19-16]|uniref:cytochrome aa3 quinol oxidase subunit II n=1 Tax=Virgibacillus salidurans TaxID=2831673 RepID=UPI001F1D0F27|nr:cytochrome aa3 quinol oxidase subunit II [Virgibacillus sp. NKC19-16]UJL45859.1 cytochrome aa3 quinol oxidase subunit II [Virgibacillus sp. NKC19-16]
MKKKRHSFKKGFALLLLAVVALFLSGCGELAVLDPKGPVAQSQKDLILYSLIFMVGIIVVVFSLFAFMLYKYRDNKPNRKEGDYKPNLHGNLKIEIVWTVIPILIVTALSIPTVETIFDLEEPPESSADREPLVVYATSADWKWFFSYPEQGIETVDYLNIPTDRAIEFRLSSAESMASFWVPQLGGQKYNMAGMENILYLQADETGVFQGRNANFTGEGFTGQTFDVNAQEEEAFNEWVEATQNQAPELTQQTYDELLKPGLLEDEMEFSSTHLAFVDHGSNDGRDYAVERHWDLYGEQLHLENNSEWSEELEQ